MKNTTTKKFYISEYIEKTNQWATVDVTTGDPKFVAIFETKSDALAHAQSLEKDNRKELNEGVKIFKLTELEYELLQEIQEHEVDGINMGYSEYDGKGISNQEKGVLSSLIQKGLVYDSYEHDDDFDSMYCSKYDEDAKIKIEII